MNSYRYLWIGESLQNQKEEILRQLEEDRLTKDVFALILPVNDKVLLNIVPGHFLKQEYYLTSGQTVFGLAGSRAEAKELAAAVILGMYRETGAFDLRTYLAKTEEAWDD